MNVCAYDGWVVDRRPLPDDPHDHDADRLPKRGCTHLRCGLCQQIVRSAPDLTLAQPHAGVDVRALFATADLATSPLVAPSTTTRLYVCACLVHLESSEHPLGEPDPAGAVQAAAQWRCAGHPIVTLPHVFDGLEVRADALPAIADRALAGELPAGAAAVDRPRAFWLARLCVRLAGTPHAEALAQAVAARLVADDVAVRVRAVQFFLHLPRYRPAMQLATLLGAHAARFVGVADPHAEVRGDRTLEHALWRLAARELPGDAALRGHARAAALDAARGSRALFFALAEGDAGWFAANAQALARTHPAQLADLVDASKRLPEPAPVIAALRG